MSAKREGFAAGLSEGKALGQQQVQRFSKILHLVEAAFADLETSTASALIELSIDLARTVVRSELVTRNDLIQPVIAEALRALPEAVTTGEITLNPIDQDLVATYLGETDKLGNWRLVADPSVEAGGCRIITRSCDIDATMKTRWLRAMQTIGRIDAWHVNPPSD
ncbi:MAG: FliH/SctL family protein [Burkholderiales bacterium]